MTPEPLFIAVGDIVVDAFIRLKQAEIMDSIDHTAKELCVTFGDKVPYEFVKVVYGVGNSPNAAVAAARLGLNSALVTNLGKDDNGQKCLESLQKNKVSTKYVTEHENLETNYHYVLWYGAERTILVKHQEYPYTFPSLEPTPAWLYLSSLGENSVVYHAQIVSYLQNHPEVKLAFQPGTYQIKSGPEVFKDIYMRSEIFFCNLEEAQHILQTRDTDIKKLLTGLADLGPKIVLITNGIKGAYAYDGTNTWFMPIYPQEPYDRTGAGDAFASTVTAALALGKPLQEALMWGPINSASVVQKIGAQEGLLTQVEIQERLAKAPADYKPQLI